MYYSLAAAGCFWRPTREVKADIALNTDSADLAKLVADKYPEVTFLPRCEELGGDTVPKMASHSGQPDPHGRKRTAANTIM